MKIPRAAVPALAIRVITHNIRFATKDPGTGEEPWDVRKPFLIDELKFTTVNNSESIICMQEVLDGQLRDILAGLNSAAVLPSYGPDYGYGDWHGPVGVEPEQGGQLGVGEPGQEGQPEQKGQPQAGGDPKAGEPKAQEPKAQEPKAQEPKTQEPKAEEPKAEEPKTEEPKAEESKENQDPKAKQDPKTEAAKEWTYIGVGRNDGKKAGEYSPIFYRPSVWNLDSFKTLWLSESPNKVGSIGWDAEHPRIVTIGHFTHRAQGQKLVAMCTHFDNAGQRAREKSARMIIKTAKEETKTPPGEPWKALVVAGDLNSEPSGEAYRILSGKYSELEDAQTRSKWTYGEKNTFTGFDRKHGIYSEKAALLDFIFVDKRKKWEMEGYSVLPNGFEDKGGVVFSDHRAVVADLKLHS